MIAPMFVISPVGLQRLYDTFELGEEFEDKFGNLMAATAGIIKAQAENAAKAVSGRVAAGMKVETETRATGEMIFTIGSSFQGYPQYLGDMVGSAGEAESRGWGTLAHRFHYGYSGANPQAGITAPTPFLEPFFEHHSAALYEAVRDKLMAQVLRGY